MRRPPKHLMALPVVLLLLAAAIGGCNGATTTTVTRQAAPAPGHALPSVGHRRDTDAVRGTAPPAQGQCGVERWAVKTLSDPAAGDVNPAPVAATIAALAALPAPAQPTDRVPGVETTTYRLTNVTVEGFKQEADGDLHLVVTDGQRTMIVEMPDPACMHGTAPAVVAQAAKVRSGFLAEWGPAQDRWTPIAHKNGTPVVATVIGVGFFDRLHHQRGVAPNGIELHPVLGYVDP